VLLLRPDFSVCIMPIFQLDSVSVTDQRLSEHFCETAAPHLPNRGLKVSFSGREYINCAVPTLRVGRMAEWSKAPAKCPIWACSVEFELHCGRFFNHERALPMTLTCRIPPDLWYLAWFFFVNEEE
jgi:hypothetical protein